MGSTASQTSSPAAFERAEYEAAKQGAAILDLSARGKLEVAGTDAAAYLQGLVTNDVETLAEGEGCYAALLDVKGRIVADLRILRDGDRFLLDLERQALPGMVKAAEMYRIGYQVEIADRTEELALLALVGPRTGEFVAVPATPREHDIARVSIAGQDCIAVATDRGLPGIDLVLAVPGREAVWDHLVEAGAIPISAACAECLRIEAGIPRWGLELDGTTFPQEAGIHERAVSYTKGCYVGQEPVARMFHRGHPNRLLRGVRLDGPVAAGAELTADGKVVGRLTSVTESPAYGAIGLSIVRREISPGDRLVVVATGATAEVVEPPFRR